MSFKYQLLQCIMLVSLLCLLGSCNVYKQDVLFRLDDDFTESDFAVAVQTTKSNYRLQTDDLITIDVFTNGGERIVDPNFELAQGGNQQGRGGIGEDFQYLIQKNGKIKLPLVGLVSLEGLTIQEAEEKLEKKYDSYYKDSFVKMFFENKRVVVLGATGGQVISLSNENMSVLEVLALAGGVPVDGKAQNIRLLRGVNSVDNQIEVFKIDLSRISTMKTGLLKVQENDVIYVEPRKRPVNEALRDTTPFLSIISSVIALILLIRTV